MVDRRKATELDRLRNAGRCLGQGFLPLSSEQADAIRSLLLLNLLLNRRDVPKGDDSH